MLSFIKNREHHKILICYTAQDACHLYIPQIIWLHIAFCRFLSAVTQPRSSHSCDYARQHNYFVSVLEHRPSTRIYIFEMKKILKFYIIVLIISFGSYYIISRIYTVNSWNYDRQYIEFSNTIIIFIDFIDWEVLIILIKT